MDNLTSQNPKFTHSLQPIIISYNNPVVLKYALSRLASLPYKFKTPIIIDNDSPAIAKDEIHSLSSIFDAIIIDLPSNMGWGGAINYFLDNYWESYSISDCILMVLAHDCFFTEFDPDELASYFKDPQAIFVCPDYPNSFTSHYNIFRSYYSKPGKVEGLVRIGHQTAFFARPTYLKRLRYDEEFWLYGGEYEIFTRAYQAGLKTYQAIRTIVVNPSSDSTSENCLLSHKLNSLYISRKRHGFIGLYLRSIVVILNAIIAYLTRRKQLSRYYFSCILFAFYNPGKGLLTYRSYPALQDKYKIVPLNP